ncbi:MAG: CopG family transcriptional regulator [Polyangia bacterium]
MADNDRSGHDHGFERPLRRYGRYCGRCPGGLPCGNMTLMALAQKKATTIALEPTADRLLTRAARSTGVSRSEFIRRQLDIVLEQYRPHPKPRSAGVIKSPLAERGDEAELFRERR